LLEKPNESILLAGTLSFLFVITAQKGGREGRKKKKKHYRTTVEQIYILFQVA